MRTTRTALAALLAVLAAAALLAAPAAAEAPQRLDERVTDLAGVLTGGGEDESARAVARLYDERQVRLWVVYVSTFDGLASQQWVDQTARLSSFGDRDALLAVAVDDREYYLRFSDEVTAAEEERLLRDVEAPLADDNWAGAAVAAAAGLSAALAPQQSSPWVVVGLLVLVVAAVGALFLWSRRRRTRRDADSAAALRRTDLTNPAEVGRFPLAALEPTSKELLSAVDNAVRTSAEELATAREEFGQEGAAPFATAVDNARAALAQAFELRQRLDDAIPESEQERHRMLVEIITVCARADRFLDQQEAEFAAKRDILLRAPDLFPTLTQEVVALQVRLPASGQALEELRGQFPPSALEPVANNVDLATEQVAFAERSVGEGRAAYGKGAGPAVVAAVRAAEGALDHARKLLDAVDNARADITAAAATLPAAMEDARQGITRAAQLTQVGGEELARAQALAEQALARAVEHQHSDPLTSLRHLADADAKLDTLLAAAEQAQAQAEHARASLEHDLAAAQAGITAAGDFIGTRRGAVGAEPRTRLAEAERHLGLARQAAAADPVAAVQHARSAAALAGQALQHAQGEVRQWESQQRALSMSRGGGGRGGGGDVGAVLGGILIGTMANQGRRGGFGGFGGFGGGGGRRSGGFNPGSFGGSGGHRGGGGRF